MRQLAKDILDRLPASYGQFARRVFRRAFPGKRDSLAASYLRGSGIEIGAMHHPLRMPPEASVRYVDYMSRDENLKRFPEIRHLPLVDPHFVEDGFALPSFSKDSVDFVAANHVLEHSDNFLRTLARWADLVRPGGVIFASVPIADLCFDRGRPITTIEHFAQDYEDGLTGETKRFNENTRSHYVEWLTISTKAQQSRRDQTRRSSPDLAKVEKAAARLLEDRAEIHFHTFSSASYAAVLRHFCSAINPKFELTEIQKNGVEVIGILTRMRKI